MTKDVCKNPNCGDDSHPRETYIDLFGFEREAELYAPDRDYEGDPPEWRMHPIGGTVPNIDIDHCGVGNTLKHYIGQEEVFGAAIEYRQAAGEIWLDADDPGRPASRDVPQLTPAQVAELLRRRPDLTDVPYAEPLVFLADSDIRGDFWGRAVAAGWVPTQRDVQLLVDACALLNLDSPAGNDRA